MIASFYRLLFTCCINGVGRCCTGTLGHVIEDLIVFLCIKMKEKEKDAHIHMISSFETPTLEFRKVC